MKPIWSGDIGFGLVSIAVNLYSATRPSELDFDMLDKRTHNRIHYKRVNEKTGKEVGWNDIVKGYDLDGRYIILQEDDFEKAAPENTRRLEISEFVDEQEVDSIYFEKPYYIEPTKRGEKPYILFREALKRSGKAAVCSFVLRTKEHLGLITVTKDALVLNQIRFAEEIRGAEDLHFPSSSGIPAKQLKMANALIEEMSGSFNISHYKDTYSAKLLRYIKAKAKGRKVSSSKMHVVSKKTDDIMEQLKASLGKKHKKVS